MDISLKISKSQDPHNTAVKNISSVFKKDGLQVMITKTKTHSLSKSTSTGESFHSTDYKTDSISNKIDSRCFI